MYGAAVAENDLMLVLEFAQNGTMSWRLARQAELTVCLLATGSLFDLLHKPTQELSFPQRIRMALDAARVWWIECLFVLSCYLSISFDWFVIALSVSRECPTCIVKIQSSFTGSYLSISLSLSLSLSLAIETHLLLESIINQSTMNHRDLKVHNSYLLISHTLST